ncbi:DegT/DnrJ/EryC1/StrS family aminotransferase [Streptomyces chumphonensis]
MCRDDDRIMGTSRVGAAEFRAGDEVVVPSFGGERAAELVRGAGAEPVFADIDAASFCLDPTAAEAAISSRTTAVFPVALFGQSPDMAGLLQLAGRRGVQLIDPGVVDDAAVRMAGSARRRQIAQYLNTRLTGVVTPPVRPGRAHLFTRYVVRVPGNGRPDRDAFRRALRARGIVAEVPVPTPAHRTAAFRQARLLPETERAAAESLALPVHEGMTRREVHRFVSACNALGGLVLEPAC